jgi:hypothetical protein
MLKSSFEYPGLHEELGVGWDLGCLMLDTENPAPGLVVDAGDTHHSANPRNRYVRGLCTEWHTTIRHGLLPNVKRQHVDRVLDGAELPTHVRVVGFENFGVRAVDESYDCVVALVEDPLLESLHNQLAVLPNVLTFPEYRPHITIGYFKPGWFEANYDYLANMPSRTVKTKGLNYGNTLVTY